MTGFCCVPGCSNDGTYHSDVLFHEFLTDKKLKKQWIRVIRRDIGPYFKVGSNLKTYREYVSLWLKSLFCAID